MKKLLILLMLLVVGSIASAKQKVEYYRYNLSWNVASDAKTDGGQDILIISLMYPMLGKKLNFQRR